MEYIKYTLGVRGMRCGECEAHVSNAIRNNFTVKKVKANRHKKVVEIYATNSLDEDKLKEVIDQTGYYYLGIINKEVAKKRFLF